MSLTRSVVLSVLFSTDSIRELLDSDSENKKLSDAFLSEACCRQAGESMQDILPDITSYPWPLPIVNEQGKYLGVISKNQFLKTLHREQVDVEESVTTEPSN